MEVITFGVGRDAQFRAGDVKMDFAGTTFQLMAVGKNYLVRMPLIGMFNVYEFARRDRDRSRARRERAQGRAVARGRACGAGPPPGHRGAEAFPCLRGLCALR